LLGGLLKLLYELFWSNILGNRLISLRSKKEHDRWSLLSTSCCCCFLSFFAIQKEHDGLFFSTCRFVVTKPFFMPKLHTESKKTENPGTISKVKFKIYVKYQAQFTFGESVGHSLINDYLI
jgi:hypothetical protein